MEYFRCRTNLDLDGEQWPTELSRVPHEGEEIQSMTRHGAFRLSLKVVKVRWVYEQDGYWAELELHDTQKRSIREFYEWYAPLVGKSVSSFI